MPVPKLICRCGHAHNLSPIPDAGWITVRDTDYERVVEAEQELAAISARGRGQSAEEYGPADRVVHDLTGRLYECPECGRLLWMRPGSTDYQAYRPEPPAT